MKLLVLLMMLTNVTLASTNSTNFKASTGEQGKSRDVIGLGIEKRLYENKSMTGFFSTYGVEYKSMTSEYDSLRVSGFDTPYRNYNEYRKDLTFQIGTGYDFGMVDISIYAGLGKSNIKTIQMNMEKNGKQYNAVGGKVTDIIEVKQELGFKIGLEFKMANPYLDISQVSYGDYNSETSIVVGASFSF